MVKFIDNIIFYLMANISDSEKSTQKAPSASFNETSKEFFLKQYQNSNAVVFKIQICFLLHNAICF